MAKNIGRGNKGSRKNSIPNLVGVDRTTAETDLTNAGFNYNTTNVSTGDTGQNNKIKTQSIPAGEVKPIGTTVNLENQTFSFSPFGAFGFTPFGAFGFTPFGFTPFGFTPVTSFSFITFGFTPFGFTPFGAFGFTPFGFTPVFAFSPPKCIDENTLISTPNGPVAAKDLKVGDEVDSVDLLEIPQSDITGGYDFDYVGMVSETLTPVSKTTTRIVAMEPSTRDKVMYFNDGIEKLFSTTQPIFTKSKNFYQVVPAGAIEIGDYLIEVNEDGSFTEILIESVNTLTKDTTVYQFNCEPADWFIAGNYLVHNK
jgi:hypothetical protein